MKKMFFLIGFCRLKNISSILLSVLIFIFIQTSTVFSQVQTVTFNFTGQVQSWTVPVCVNTIDVQVAGARGGGINPGNGAVVTGTLNVTPGQVLQIRVGGQGGTGFNSGGWNGGGGGQNSSLWNYASGGGGGASDIRIAPYNLNNRIVVAAGGGGTGSGDDYVSGGHGGCNSGSPGSTSFGSGAGGGTQFSGGAGGSPWISSGNWGQSGSLGQGGAGGSDPCYNYAPGGGGGGGYYGGGGGGSDCYSSGLIGGGAGGGGSSLVPVGGGCTAGQNNGHGYVIINYSEDMAVGDASNTGPYCEGDQIQLMTSGAGSYSWTGPSGFSSAQQNPTIPNATSGNAGTYYVTITTSGCTATASTTVQVHPNPTPTPSSNSPVCEGEAIQLSVGSVPGASYSWSGPGGWTANTQNPTRPNATLPMSGSYSVTVSGNHGCSGTGTTDVLVMKPPQVSLSVVNEPDCYGDSNGEITVFISEGVPDYTIQYQGNTITTSESQYTVTGLTAGEYSFTITDANGCQSSASITINQPPQLSLNITQQTDQNCLTPGSATVMGSGGTPSYSYSWPPEAAEINNNTANSINAGTYVVTITDNNGCTATETITIIDIGQIYVSAEILTDIMCYGETNGEVQINIDGGDPVFNADWGTGSQTSGTHNFIISDLASGDYSITITDDNGCQDIANVGLNNPDPIVLSTNIISNYNGQHVSCYGSSDGVATVYVDGGTEPFSYQWSENAGSQTTQEVDGLSAGTYSVTVTDSNSCSMQASITLVNPQQISGIVSVTSDYNGQDIACYGENNGSASVNVNGGTQPYTYQWDSGTGNQTTQEATGLSSGTYHVTVTDANSCTYSGSVSLSQPEELSVDILSITEQICETYGSAVVEAQGGTEPYNYIWPQNAGGVSGGMANSLSTGTYIVTVLDANECEVTTLIEVEGIGNVEANIEVVSHPSCYGYNDGIINVNISEGTPNFHISFDDYSLVTGNYSSEFVGLSSGIYNVSISDFHDCSTIVNVELIDPPELEASAVNIIPQSCQIRGSAAIHAVGGTSPYQFEWPSNAGGVDENTANALLAGQYTVTVTDNNGCTTTASFIIRDDSDFSVQLKASDANCFGEKSGKLEIDIFSGTHPYSIYIDNTFYQSFSNTFIVDNIAPGDYNIVVSDSYGCNYSGNFSVEEPSELSAVVNTRSATCLGVDDAYIEILAEGGTKPYKYQWGNEINEESYIRNLSFGDFNIAVIDDNGCVYNLGNILLEENFNECINIPNAFTPDGDGINDQWIIENIEHFPDALIVVYNRWGQQVYYGRGNDEPWDGKWNGKFVPPASYFYVVNIYSINQYYSGSVTVIY